MSECSSRDSWGFAVLLGISHLTLREKLTEHEVPRAQVEFLFAHYINRIDIYEEEEDDVRSRPECRTSCLRSHSSVKC